MSKIHVAIVPVGWVDGDPFVVEFDAKCESIVERLNDIDTCDFTIALTDVLPEELLLGVHEAIITYPAIGDIDTRFWWMRPLSADVDLGANQLTVHCFGLLSWFQERVLGEATDNNLGGNMSFEDGDPLQQFDPDHSSTEDEWLTTGTTDVTADTLDATPVTSDFVIGMHAAQLVGSSDEILSFLYRGRLRATVGLDVGWEDTTPARTAYLSAWYKIIDTGYTPWKGPPPPGLQLELHNTLDPSTDQPRVYSAPLDPENVAHDEWVRIELSEGVRIRTDTVSLHWLLASIPGTILWDGVRFTLDAVLLAQGTDLSDVCARLVNYAQDLLIAPPWTPSLKTDLSIVTDPDPTGIVTSRAFNLHERSVIWDLLQQYVTQEDGPDIWIDVDASGTRTFKSAPSKGSAKPAALLTVGATADRAGTATVDARAGTNAVVWTSSYQGPSGEYGYANDPSGWGGNTRESVKSAPSDAPIDTLMGLAAGDLARHAQPDVLPTIFVPAQRALVDPNYLLQTGDVVPYVAAVGWFDVDQDIRIAALEINPHADKVGVVPLTAERGTDAKLDFGKILRSHDRRVNVLEQSRTAVQPAPRVVRETVGWGMETPRLLESPPLPNANGGTLDHARVTVRAASTSGSVTVDVKVNGSVVSTVTLGVGVTEAYSSKIGVRLVPDKQNVSFEITGAGTDALGLYCEGRVY